MSDMAARIVQNVARVREQIAKAAERCGRKPDEITLVAVTKYVGAEEAGALVAAGCRDMGESRPQELCSKAQELASQPIRWHLVGHLQRNKVRRTLPLVSLLHSVDSERLLAAIDPAAAELGRRIPVLLEVNISGDQSKHGLLATQVEPLLAKLPEYQNVQVRGLMTMAHLKGGSDVARADFAALRQLRDRLRGVCPAGTTLDELSMGMSRDFEEAIEEGATLVRVGSALFEGIS